MRHVQALRGFLPYSEESCSTTYCLLVEENPRLCCLGVSFAVVVVWGLLLMVAVVFAMYKNFLVTAHILVDLTWTHFFRAEFSGSRIPNLSVSHPAHSFSHMVICLHLGHLANLSDPLSEFFL